MRKEATLQQWGALYEAATKIKELQPWENFWDILTVVKISGCIFCPSNRAISHII